MIYLEGSDLFVILLLRYTETFPESLTRDNPSATLEDVVREQNSPERKLFIILHSEFTCFR